MFLLDFSSQYTDGTETFKFDNLGKGVGSGVGVEEGVEEKAEQWERCYLFFNVFLVGKGVMQI